MSRHVFALRHVTFVFIILEKTGFTLQTSPFYFESIEYVCHHENISFSSICAQWSRIRIYIMLLQISIRANYVTPCCLWSPNIKPLQPEKSLVLSNKSVPRYLLQKWWIFVFSIRRCITHLNSLNYTTSRLRMVVYTFEI